MEVHRAAGEASKMEHVDGAVLLCAKRKVFFRGTVSVIGEGVARSPEGERVLPSGQHTCS